MREGWTTSQAVLTLGALLAIGSLVAIPVRVAPTLRALAQEPLSVWTALTLSWWLPPLLAVPATVALVTAARSANGALRRRRLIAALALGWTALTAILAGVVGVLTP